MSRPQARVGPVAAAVLAALSCATAAAAPWPSIAPTPAPAAAEGAPADPLGRDTPRGCFLGFLQAAQWSSIAVAADYLQMPKLGARATPEETVRDLKFVLDQRFTGNVNAISRLREGALDDGLPPELDKVGALQGEDEEPQDVLLVRVDRKEGGPIWLFSADTLRDATKLYRSLSHPEVGSRLPAFLNVRVGVLPLWGGLIFLLALPALFGVGWLLVTLLARVFGLVAGRRAPELPELTRSLRRPLAFLLMLVLHRWFVELLSLPLLGRYRYNRLFWVLVVVGLCWIVLRVIELLGRRRQVASFGDFSSYTVISLGRRIMQFAVVTTALFIVLKIFDLNPTAWLAGIGVGGIALAFAAQKSLENIFGGFTVLGGRVMRPGDMCKIGTYRGEVEDISLYSTRLRTLDRTLVHIPNGQLATEKIENLSRRDKFWFHPILGLRYETSADQMRKVLAELRAMLAEDPRVEPETARVRFIRFGAYSLDVEVFGYVRVPTWADFLAAQEELHLKIMSLVEKSGTDIAFPSQTSYLGKDRALGAWEEPFGKKG